MNNSISRRAFIKTGTATAAVGAIGATLVGCSTEQDATTESSAPMESAASKSVAGERYDVTETIDTDIVVVGSGTAGSISAISAAQAGANVIVLEKLGFIGGNANAASGILSCNSEVQIAAGTAQDPENFVASAVDWHKMNVDQNLWRRFANKTGEDLDFIRSLGVQVVEVVPGTTFAYVEDENNIQGNPMDIASGSFGVKVRTGVMEELGVEVHTNTSAVELVKDGDAVVGVIAENEDGGYTQYNAQRVILACGSMAASDEMIEKLTNEDASRLEYRGMPGATGDGHNMAIAAGGYSTGNYALGKEGACIAGSELESSVNMVGAMQPTILWLNQDCERFVDESFGDYGQMGNLPMMQGRSYSILDSKQIAYYQENGIPRGFADMVAVGTMYDDIAGDFETAAQENAEFVKIADNLEDLASQLSLDPELFVQAVTAYNTLCENGEDTEYGKDAEYLWTIEEGPFYGLELHSNIMNALGGIRTNKDMQAVDSKFNAIPGLYAAGTEVEGFESKTYEIMLPGTCQAICIYTGRIAGTHAAESL